MGGSWDLVPSPGTAAEQAAAPAILPAAGPPVQEAQDQLPLAGSTAWVGVPALCVAGQ